MCNIRIITLIGALLYAIAGCSKSGDAPNKSADAPDFPQDTYKGQPFVYYFELLDDKDRQTRMEAMRAIMDMPSWDTKITARIDKLAWNELEAPETRIMALNYVYVQTKWNKQPQKLQQALALCESISSERIELGDKDYINVGLPCHVWKDHNK